MELLLKLNLNLCKFFFASAIISTTILGLLVILVEPYIPVFFPKLFRYGKFASKESTPSLILEVPKSYFRHFYLTAGLIHYPLFFYEVSSVYVFGNEVSGWVETLLDISCGTQRTASVSATHVYIAVILLLLQTLRRFYDTQFVSVFSEKAKMNLAHYVIGMAYYVFVMLSVLNEAPKFAKKGTIAQLRFSDVGLWEAFAVILFSWAWYHQHVATVILADLRKNRKGEVVSQSYRIPQGDWFKYVSSPHCIAEIIMYSALTLLLWNSISWWYVFAWVLVNQVETILMSHWWYQSHFQDFPKTTKALVPFIY